MIANSEQLPSTKFDRQAVKDASDEHDTQRTIRKPQF